MPATPNHKLPRQAILRKRADFDRIRQRGSRLIQGSLVCNYLQESISPTRAAFVVGKRCGAAVTRNRIKRRLREIYRQFLRPGLTPGLQIVWIARQNAARASYAELKEDMLRLARKAGWLVPPDRPSTP